MTYKPRFTKDEKVNMRRQFLYPLLLLPRLFLQQEGIVLVAVFVVVISLWGFIALADEVLEGDTEAFDLWVMHRLRYSDDSTRPIGPSWLIRGRTRDYCLGRDYRTDTRRTRGGGVFAPTTRLWGDVVSPCRYVGWNAAELHSQIFLGRERPDVTLHLVTVHSPSFPSGHAMLSAVVYLTLGALLAQVVPRRADKMYFIIVAFVLTLLVGLSRVYLGVHYPTDVLAGWSVGLAVGARVLGGRAVPASPRDGGYRARKYVEGRAFLESTSQ